MKKKTEILSNNYTECKCTVGEVMSLWLDDIKNKVKDSTYSVYAMKLNKHILPCFAGLRYENLTADKINDFISDKLKNGLSEKYVSDIVILIKSAAKFGQRNFGYVNRIEYVTLPKCKSNAERPMLSDKEKKILIEELANNLTCSNAGVLLALSTGIRIGELCALKWGDIDLTKRTITVRNTVQRISNVAGTGTKVIIASPKSKSSLREIPLPDFLIPLFVGIQNNSNSYLLSGKEKIVEPRTLQYRFNNILKKLNLPHVNFHSLRHKFATDCITMGIDVKTLSEILGHSSVEITLSRYVHSSMERKKHCMKIYSDNFPTK